jgi:uncharacterized membrane protein
MREFMFGILALFASLALMVGCPPETLPDDDDAQADDDASDDDDDDATDDDDDDDVAYVEIEVSSLSGDVQYFSHETDDGVTVNFFAVMGDDGDPHVAFDACEVCFPAGLGYSQSGDQMVCNNCGNRFGINDIGTANVGGGCWPGYLELTVEEGTILIDPVVLDGGAWYF